MRAGLQVEDLQRMIAAAPKRRHALDGGRIGALYGHSTPRRLLREPAEPPALL